MSRGPGWAGLERPRRLSECSIGLTSSTYRVENLDRATAELRDRHVEIGAGFEIPHGRGVEVVNPGPQRIALYQCTRPGAEERLAGRRDF